MLAVCVPEGATILMPVAVVYSLGSSDAVVVRATVRFAVAAVQPVIALAALGLVT